jgi:hypothetical protein
VARLSGVLSVGRAHGKRLVGVDLDLYLDAMNLITDRRVIESDTSFEAPTIVGEERWYRVGLEYRY